MPAALNLGKEWERMDNRKTVTLTNPNGDSTTTSHAVKEDVLTADIIQGGFDIPIVLAKWHVWSLAFADTTFVPARDGYVTDATGNKWYINGAPAVMTNGTRYELETTLEGGKVPQ